ncbi:MAG: sigma-70 family RNA polymerase sigma factor [Pirellulaceae bacterium]
MPSDAELIELILSGDRQQYAVLVKRYERMAVAIAMRGVHDFHRADDVAQEAFVAAFEKLSSLRDRSNFSAWLMGIVRRKAAKAFHRNRRMPTSASDLDLNEHPATSHQTSQDARELIELVEQLPEQERLVIGLRHFDGHSMQEIATITGRPLGTVTKQISRAHERLHRWFTEENSNERYESSSRQAGPSRPATQ